MKARPFGKPPVFISRNENSTVLSDASIASASKPDVATDESVSRASFSTLGTSSALTPLRPTEKVACARTRGI
eukprot:6199751-Pleurochrysis_carterae.AAC.2